MGCPENPQFKDRFCARICARDASERVETEEMQQAQHDGRRPSVEVSGHVGDRARRRRRKSYGS